MGKIVLVICPMYYRTNHILDRCRERHGKDFSFLKRQFEKKAKQRKLRLFSHERNIAKLTGRTVVVSAGYDKGTLPVLGNVRSVQQDGTKTIVEVLASTVLYSGRERYFHDEGSSEIYRDVYDNLAGFEKVTVDFCGWDQQ